MLANRVYLGRVLHALLHDEEADSPSFGPPVENLRWEAFSVGQGQVGFVWNEPTSDPLQIGFGGHVSFNIGNEPFALTVLARMLKLTAAEEVISRFGKVKFAAGFPVPDFLQSASLGGEYDDKFSLNLTVTDPQGSREFILPTNVLPWDIARVGTFVLRAWLRKKAQDSPPAPSKNFFQRVNEHLFPMLGDPENVI